MKNSFYKLMIVTAIAALLTNAAFAQYWSLTGNSGTTPSNFLGTTGARSLILKTNGQERMRIDKAGNVGIGTTTPAAKLDVEKGDALINEQTIGLGGGNILGNTVFGYQVLHAANTGLFNTGVGYESLQSNTGGWFNTATGYYALRENISGQDNTATGEQALGYNTNGNYNTATGSEALYLNTTGNENTATGMGALFNNTTGIYNTAMGTWSLLENAIGNNNTAMGYDALYNSWFPSNNTGMGYSALYNNFGGSNLTAVGYSADVNDTNLVNSSAFGNSALITASNQVRIGDAGVTSIGGYVNWSNISDGRVKKNIKQNVPGLEFINKLQPVTYNLDLDACDKIVQHPTIKDRDGSINQPTQEETSARQAKEKIVYTGFVAQDVEKAAQSLNYDFSGVDAPKDNKDLYALRYSDFVVPLVKAVQELSQKNDSMQRQIDELKAIIASSSNTGIEKFESSNFNLQTALLDQNSPNPFSQQTIINYFIPETANSAEIKIYSVQGEELKSFVLNDKGNGQIIINGNSLQPGVYVYVLIVAGKTIDTKQMILTR